MKDGEILTDEQLFAEAERLINFGHYDEAHACLKNVKEKNGRWYFIQGKIYKFKNWYNEARKCFEIAIEKEPEAEEYKEALDGLAILEKIDDEPSQNEPSQMGNTDCGNICFEICFEGCCAGLCEGICNGI